MIDLHTVLNPEQYEAATAGGGPLLVLAAAGTGKTQTLVYRVAHLIDQGIPPYSILLLTFTNRAASEMLERARAVAGDQAGWTRRNASCEESASSSLTECRSER